jgi:hypothetical protein
VWIANNQRLRTPGLKYKDEVRFWISSLHKKKLSSASTSAFQLKERKKEKRKKERKKEGKKEKRRKERK